MNRSWLQTCGGGYLDLYALIVAGVATALLGRVACGQSCGGMEFLGSFGGGSTSSARSVSFDGATIIGESSGPSQPQRGFRWTLSEGFQNIDPAGGYVFPMAVSGDGATVVGNVYAGRREHAFRWTAAEGVQFLGTLGGVYSTATSVSADGSVVVGYGYDAAGLSRAFRWTSVNGLQDLGTLGFSPTYANAVSADGRVIIGDYTVLGGVRAFRWSEDGGMQDLGDIGGELTQATSISTNGTVIVGVSTTAAGDHRCFRWTAREGMRQLIDGVAAPTGLSADGSVVVGFTRNPEARYRAFRWSFQDGLQDLGTLGGEEALAAAVSADGRIVVGNSRTAQGHERAFRWTSSEGMRDLGTLGGSGSNAVCVSADGSTITGWAHNHAQVRTAYRWVDASNGAVRILTEPVDCTFVPGQQAAFSVVASGESIVYQWRRAGIPLVNGSRVSGADTAALQIANVQAADQGFYDCVLQNACRTVTTVSVELSCKPAIEAQPQGGDFVGGQPVSLSVVASMANSYRWRRNGVALFNGLNFQGVATPRLTINADEPSQSGTYTVAITNACGVRISR